MRFSGVSGGGGITSGVDAAFARLGSYGSLSPRADNGNAMIATGVMQGSVFTDDASARNPDVNGLHFVQDTSSVSANIAKWVSASAPVGQFDALPWFVWLGAISHNTSINWTLNAADAAGGDTIVDIVDAALAYLGLEFKTESGDSNFYVTHDTAGGGAATRVDTTTAVIVHPNAFAIKAFWTSLTSVTVEIYAATDLSAALSTTVVTTRLPVTGDPIFYACAVQTQTTADRSQYTYRFECGTSRGGNP